MKGFKSTRHAKGVKFANGVKLGHETKDVSKKPSHRRRRGEWTCHACQHRNFSHENTCFRCNVEKVVQIKPNKTKPSRDLWEGEILSFRKEKRVNAHEVISGSVSQDVDVYKEVAVVFSDDEGLYLSIDDDAMYSEFYESNGVRSRRADVQFFGDDFVWDMVQDEGPGASSQGVARYGKRRLDIREYVELEQVAYSLLPVLGFSQQEDHSASSEVNDEELKAQLDALGMLSTPISTYTRPTLHAVKKEKKRRRREERLAKKMEHAQRRVPPPPSPPRTSITPATSPTSSVAAGGTSNKSTRRKVARKQAPLSTAVFDELQELSESGSCSDDENDEQYLYNRDSQSTCYSMAELLGAPGEEEEDRLRLLAEEEDALALALAMDLSLQDQCKAGDVVECPLGCGYFFPSHVTDHEVSIHVDACLS